MSSILKTLVHLLGVAKYLQAESKSKKVLPPVSVSLSNLSLQQKDFNVRIIHAGGLVELYKDTIPASEVMKKYPGMCLVRPQVFKSPLKSLLNPEEKLLPGQKFYLVPYTTVRKLKHKHSSADKRSKQASGEKKIVETGDGCCSEDSFCSAKDFFVDREKWSNCVLRKCGRGMKKPFTPPIRKPRMWHRPGWEPSLPSVEELSPDSSQMLANSY